VKRVLSLLVAGATLASAALAVTSCARRDRAAEAAKLHALAERYFDARFDFRPTTATEAGDHGRDTKLEDFSELRIQFEQVALRAFLDTLATAIDSTALPPADQIDYALLKRDARTRLLHIEDLKVFERDPDLYHSTASRAVYALLKRDFAPLDERLAAVAAREEQIPKLLEDAKRNLKDPPEIWTRIAIEQARGTVQFFAVVVPAAARGATDPAVRARVLRANGAALGAARDYLYFLQNDLLARSRGEFALGRDLFMKDCAVEEWITESPESILARALVGVEENHRRMAEVCRQIDPQASVRAVVERTAGHHPRPAGLLDSCRTEMKRLRQFIVDRNLVPLPAGEDLAVAETPVFERSLTFASTDTPGPLEAKATEAFFYITPVDPKWSQPQQDEYLREFCRGLIYTTASHEAYPGHFIQGLYLRLNPSLVRKLTRSDTFSEGWAHYCEQMVLDEGFSKDPELRLYQLHDALLRLCRAALTVRLHVEGWTSEQAVAWMVREGYQERINAEREVKRYTTEPLVLSYWWGKQEVLRLRDLYHQRVDGAFSLADFHRRLLEMGEPPLPLAERMLLAGAEGRGRRGK
jgi:uncharacterized protein (DUF885 family)